MGSRQPSEKKKQTEGTLEVTQTTEKRATSSKDLSLTSYYNKY